MSEPFRAVSDGGSYYVEEVETGRRLWGPWPRDDAQKIAARRNDARRTNSDWYDTEDWPCSCGEIFRSPGALHDHCFGMSPKPGGPVAGWPDADHIPALNEGGDQ